MRWVVVVRSGLPVVVEQLQFSAKHVLNCQSVIGIQQFGIVLFGWAETSFGVWQDDWFRESEQRSDGFQFCVDIFISQDTIHQQFS